MNRLDAVCYHLKASTFRQFIAQFLALIYENEASPENSAARLIDLCAVCAVWLVIKLAKERTECAAKIEVQEDVPCLEYLMRKCGSAAHRSISDDGEENISCKKRVKRGEGRRIIRRETHSESDGARRKSMAHLQVRATRNKSVIESGNKSHTTRRSFALLDVR